MRARQIREFYEAQLEQVRSDARDALAATREAHRHDVEVIRSQGAAAVGTLERELAAERARSEKLEERLARWVGLDEAPLKQLHRSEASDQQALDEGQVAEAAAAVANELEARGLVLPG